MIEIKDASAQPKKLKSTLNGDEHTIHHNIDALGEKADAVATTDTGTFSLLALFKRLLQRATSSLNTSGTALASAARIADTNSADISNPGCRGVQVVVDVTAFSATPQVSFSIDGKDPVSGNYYTIFTSQPISAAVATSFFTVYPGITVNEGQSESYVIPATFRIHMTHGNTDSMTYSVGYHLIK